MGGGMGGGLFSQFLKWDCGLLSSQNPLGQLQILESGNKAYKCPKILLDIFYVSKTRIDFFFFFFFLLFGKECFKSWSKMFTLNKLCLYF